MSMIKENKKFKRTKEQEIATNPDGNTATNKNRSFNLETETIKEKQTKH